MMCNIYDNDIDNASKDYEILIYDLINKEGTDEGISDLKSIRNFNSLFVSQASMNQNVYLIKSMAERSLLIRELYMSLFYHPSERIDAETGDFKSFEPNAIFNKKGSYWTFIRSRDSWLHYKIASRR